MSLMLQKEDGWTFFSPNVIYLQSLSLSIYIFTYTYTLDIFAKMIFEFFCIATCMLHIKMGRDCTLAQILHDLVLFFGMSCAFGIV